jgi:hypothetical protein
MKSSAHSDSLGVFAPAVPIQYSNPLSTPFLMVFSYLFLM